ncbi:MAG: CBS domain-containing protein [Candidatus Aenigmarchaeota archaeon]|nr:CBS domain-containing protein [Candidatus Aenigmarchaeota archaeon]
MKKVRNFMNRRVVFFTPSDNIFDVAKAFCDKRISGAPVVANRRTRRVIGIVSESDLVKFMGHSLYKGSKVSASTCTSTALILLGFMKLGSAHLNVQKDVERLTKVRVKDVMSSDVIAVSPEESIFDAAEKMDEHDVNRLPVVQRGRLVGIIARSDLVKALVE